MKELISDELYTILEEEETNTIKIKGILRLNGLSEYAPIAAILENRAAQGNCMVVDVIDLEFLNSSGIAMLSKFIIGARNQNVKDLTFIGSKKIAWQSKSLANLRRLYPALQLEIV